MMRNLTKPIGKVSVLTLLCGSPLLANAAIGGSKTAVDQYAMNELMDSSTDYTQQVVKITGTVVDASGVPIIGANVIVKGTTNGTITDMDGHFTLEGPPNATLVVSYVGFVDQQVSVKGNAPVSITLKEDAEALDELVVVGFGTQKKVNVTGAVATVGGEDLVKRPVYNVASSLQGKLPGLAITQASGQPGSESVSMRIRGMGTFSDAGSDPLVIIDGISGDLNTLNTADIENITVLKDAASAAIYGARAANGVILVTTKTGRKGKMNLT